MENWQASKSDSTWYWLSARPMGVRSCWGQDPAHFPNVCKKFSTTASQGTKGKRTILSIGLQAVSYLVFTSRNDLLRSWVYGEGRREVKDRPVWATISWCILGKVEIPHQWRGKSPTSLKMMVGDKTKVMLGLVHARPPPPAALQIAEFLILLHSPQQAQARWQREWENLHPCLFPEQ